MARQVAWTKTIFDTFVEEAMLNDDEIYVMRSRIKGESITKQALHLNVSEATVNRMISSLKEKYDAAQKNNPLLPKRET